ncbi:helix-turn-helix domain-containing protein [Fructobacillus sp. CRL 2054]|uniref:helix-turn-helix domain-containing protein n=1 Tax=Fructobacillus sp. CRL 2054 TaxID=2763007 RepID=UPI0023796714
MRNRVGQLRHEKGMTEEELGEVFGVTGSLIRNIECRRNEPRVEMWHALANYFDVHVWYLMGIIEE